MNTRQKNKSAHPAIPVMTPAQMSAAGISQTQPKRPRKKLTKDQQIAALREDLRMAQEMLQDRPASTRSIGRTASGSPDHDGDTELATEEEEDESTLATGRKRNSQRPAGTGIKLKRTRAMGPFEFDKVHSGTTGLVDDWRSKIADPPNSTSPSLLTPRASVTPHTSVMSLTPERRQSPNPLVTRPLQHDEEDVTLYPLPRFNSQRQKIYPGVKDLPLHIRTDFRKHFIRVVMRNVFGSEQPWINPDLPSLQAVYDKVYSGYRARLRCNDAVVHPTIAAVGVVRSRIGTAAVFAVQRHLTNMYRQKRLKTLDARAAFVATHFKSDDDHPFIWREYVVGDIENHPEIGGYQTTRRGAFQSQPILETLLVYYTSFGIMESPPTEDPGEGNRPVGVLAMVAAAVERAYRMHSTGDYIEASQSFNADLGGPRTKIFMDYITKDLAERQWDGIFRGVATVSRRVADEVAIAVGAAVSPPERARLPPSDPPTPPGGN